MKPGHTELFEMYVQVYANIHCYSHSSQKLDPQQGITTASLISSLQIPQLSSSGTFISSETAGIEDLDLDAASLIAILVERQTDKQTDKE